MPLSLTFTNASYQEHGGNINEALNAYFNEGDRSRTMFVHYPLIYYFLFPFSFIFVFYSPNILISLYTYRENSRHVTLPEDDDLMDIDDDPVQLQPRAPLQSLLPSSRSNLNPFSLLDDRFTRGLLDDSLTRRYFNGISNFGNSEPFVSHPREVREIPIEVKDGKVASGHSGSGPVIEEVTGSEYDSSHPAVRGTVIFDEKDANPTASATHNENEDVVVTGSHSGNARAFGSENANSPDIDDVEEEMIRAAIEASRREIEGRSHVGPDHERRPSHPEDSELAHAVSLSLKVSY